METIHFQKPRSKTRIEIVTDPSEEWFLHVRTIEKSSGNVKHSSMIIRKDLPTWMRYIESNGWIKETSSVS
jgi:hypothetical protein